MDGDAVSNKNNNKTGMKKKNKRLCTHYIQSRGRKCILSARPGDRFCSFHSQTVTTIDSHDHLRFKRDEEERRLRDLQQDCRNLQDSIELKNQQIVEAEQQIVEDEHELEVKCQEVIEVKQRISTLNSKIMETSSMPICGRIPDIRGPRASSSVTTSSRDRLIADCSGMELSVISSEVPTNLHEGSMLADDAHPLLIDHNVSDIVLVHQQSMEGQSIENCLSDIVIAEDYQSSPLTTNFKMNKKLKNEPTDAPLGSPGYDWSSDALLLIGTVREEVQKELLVLRSTRFIVSPKIVDLPKISSEQQVGRILDDKLKQYGLSFKIINKWIHDYLMHSTVLGHNDEGGIITQMKCVNKRDSIVRKHLRIARRVTLNLKEYLTSM